MITALITAYILSTIFTWCFVMYSRYQFKDERKIDGKEHDQWHPWGAWARALFYLMPLICMIGKPDWKDILLMIAINLPLFDIGINVVALDQSVFYVGKTAGTDKKIGMWKWPIYLLFLIGSIIVKIYVN